MTRRAGPATAARWRRLGLAAGHLRPDHRHHLHRHQQRLAGLQHDGPRGDNLYTATLLALDPKTGKLKWHRQESAARHLGLRRGLRGAAGPDGKGTSMVHLNKNGFVYVMDKDRGR
jgi:glucose dehydrogenase